MLLWRHGVQPAGLVDPNVRRVGSRQDLNAAVWQAAQSRRLYSRDARVWCLTLNMSGGPPRQRLDCSRNTRLRASISAPIVICGRNATSSNYTGF